MLFRSALHSENLALFIIEQSEFEFILGLPWLEKHNPTISWSEREIQKWSEFCHLNCVSSPKLSVSSTSIESPQNDNVTIPPEYMDLKEVFSKGNATKLPPTDHMTVPLTL